jgi:hypothetical protein
VSQRQSRTSEEGLSIGAASANVGWRRMELPDIQEEMEEEITPKPRSTWECHSYRILRCGMSHYLSIPLTRPIPMSLSTSLLSSWLLSSW